MPEGKTHHKLIVFAAPSGAGKTTIAHRVLQRFSDQLQFSVSSTTRPARAGETDGVDYDFLSDTDFDAYVEKGDFIEHEAIHGWKYGTRKSRIEEQLESGVGVLFDVDVLGALSIKRLFPEALLIYIDVPSMEELRRRLAGRKREDDSEVERRLQRYEFERSRADRFDRIVMNDDLERATAEVFEIVDAYLNEGGAG